MRSDEIVVYLCKNEKDSNRQLEECLDKYFEHIDKKKIEVNIERTKFNKPYIVPNCGIYFSVSHTKDIYAVAFSNMEIGFDIEQCRRANEIRIAKRYFTQEEAEFIEKYPHRFLEVWTAKESYVKYTGEGIAGGLSNFCVIKDDKVAREISDVDLMSGKLNVGVTFAICSKNIQDVLFVMVDKK